jgi:predicted house-cleaning noncanonical NTP pyrophosphatase (MazG superfamily)
VKLVRDEIPKIIEDSGRSCKYHFAGLDEYKVNLYEKLREELDEFIEAPSYEEAADMWQVFSAICEVHKLCFDCVEAAALEKERKRGGFKDRIILEVINESR